MRWLSFARSKNLCPYFTYYFQTTYDLCGMHKKDFIFGVHPVLEALKSGQAMDKILLQRRQKEEAIQEIQREARARNIPVQLVPVEKMQRLTRKNHQGVIAFTSPVHFAKLEDVVAEVYERGELPLLLILDRLTDVRNFGAVLRSADAAGVHAVILPERGAARIGEDAAKTSAGALFHIPLCRVRNLTDAVEYLQGAGLRIAAATEKTETPCFGQDLQGPLAVIMGAEEDGVSADLLKLADLPLRIPMAGQVSSLNVSVAAGILLFEVVRQRSQG